MPYTILLDIGTTSIGFCVAEVDDLGETKKIKKLGVRIFNVSEDPQTGASLAEPRRLARGLRRRLRRKTYRLQEAKNLLIAKGVKIVPSSEVNKLRVTALDELISESDFANIILLLIKNRGFKSNRKHQKKSDDGKLLEAIDANEKRMEDGLYRTVGEMLYYRYRAPINTAKGEKEVVNCRNKTGDYSKTVHRSQLENELRILFGIQRKLGNRIATSEIEEKIIDIFNWQRNYDEGPGKGSKYTAEYKVGECQFEKGEKRAPKASWAFERAISLQSINNLTLISDKENRVLTIEERQKIISLLDKKSKITFNDVRSTLGLNLEYRFNLARYNIKEAKKLTYEAIVEKVEKSTLASMEGSSKIKKCLSKEKRTDTNLIDKIAVVLSMAKSDDKRIEKFKDEGLTNLTIDEIDQLLALDFKKFGHLSFKALYNVLPYLEQGFRYSDACKEWGYDHTQKVYPRQILLNSQDIYEEINDIGSPAVKRALSQSLKVINAIIRKYGSPAKITIEMAREFAKPKMERDKIERENNERFLENSRKREELVEKFGVSPNRDNLIIYKLYEEQLGKSVYSGKTIDVNRLFEPNYVNVDHIIPYSRCFDDGYNNKVLVLKDENLEKRDRTPYEYLGATKEWETFLERVASLYSSNIKKRSNLTRKNIDETELKQRALNDTRYITRFLLNLMQDRLVFDDSIDIKKRVMSVNGGITAKIRHTLGISKIRADGDKHHAIDAAVLSCVSNSVLQKLANLHNGYESYTYLAPNQLAPYPTFVEELKALSADTKQDLDEGLKKIGYREEDLVDISPIFVSRMPRRKGKGRIHKDTIYSDKHADEDIIIKKQSIKELTLVKEDGEWAIKDYYQKDKDKATYQVLLERLIAYNHDAKEAFAEPVYKPAKDGRTKNQIKSVKVVEQRNSGIVIGCNGFAKNCEMVRVDIYTKNGKFYGVPVYTKDVYAKVLPNKAATAHKVEKDWTVMDDAYQFKFSLYPNDLIKIVDKKISLVKSKKDAKSKLPDTCERSETFAYYTGFNISSAKMLFVTHDGCYKGGKGITTLQSLEKYAVDVLGNVSKMPITEAKPKS